jgi:serine/threonine protein kinase/ABC-type branched-subunit amino acid transport system substrate-binding protein
MECPYCKAENRDGVRYCGSCGKLLGTSTDSNSAITGSSSSRSLVAGSRLQGGRYVITKVLGQGGMGAALLATDIRLDGKSVVIKELISDTVDPDQRQDDIRNFKREMSLLAHLDHPLIPNVTDHFQEGSRYFIVQEFVDGENLEERLERLNQPLKERDVLVCASEILDVLDYLSQQNPPVIHRDIKPANIIIGTKDRRAHLVDFGIARAEVAKNVQRKQTTALGTPGYAPPEQYQGNADPRSDLYALAATMHHLLTNRDPRNHPPFSYPPVRAFNQQLSPEIDRVLQRALNNDINQRYQSPAAMKRDIDDILLHRFGIAGGGDSYILGASGVFNPISGVANISSQTTRASSAPLAPGFNSNIGSVPTQVGAVTPPYLGQQPGMFQGPPSSPSQPIPPPPPYASGGYPPPPVPQPPARRSSRWLLPVVLLAILLLGIGLVYALIPRPGTKSGSGGSTPTAAGTTITTNKNGIGVTPIGKEAIGISDGSYALDTDRRDGSLKLQAALSYRNGDTSSAIALWNQAASEETTDAEALIYLENQRTLNFPHVTVVVGTMLSGGSSVEGVGRDDLQGAYVAQKEFNDNAKLNGGFKVRLLIANTGSQTSYATPVAQQIVQLAQKDPTFVGVMGMPYSSRSVEVARVFADAHIPMVSQTASSDQLTSISPYFFRVAPSNKIQGINGAKYAEQVLHAKTAALFVDISDPYSQSLAQDFQQQFQTDGSTIVATEHYTVGKTGNIPALLQDALSKKPDTIYFSGYSSDVGVVLSNLPADTPSSLSVMGGDALYELGGYPKSSRAQFNRLRFTAFAYPDEWDVLGLTAKKPGFFSEYPAAFNPNNQAPAGIYGFTRATNDAILSYDATVALLTGCNIELKAGKTKMTPQDLRDGLSQVNGSNSVQGVSGQVSFGANGDPVDKAIVILYVDPVGHIHMTSTVEGRFLK